MQGLAVALLALATGAAAEVTVEAKPQIIYGELTDKLRIGGKGFSELGDNPQVTFLPPMPHAFNLTVRSDTQLTLGLKKGGKWPTPSDPAAGGQTLYLMTLKKDGSDESLLSNPVPVATVMVTPSVQRGFDKVVYMTGSKKLNINGTGFKAKSTQLVFDPPLVKDVDYLLNTRSSTMMQLTLRTGRKWRSDGQPGPLKLRRINTGAGFLRIDAKYGGVTVAEVQVDLGAHGVRVETTAAEQRVYQSTPRLTVTGSGFNDSAPGLNTLKWGNSLRGKGINYTIAEVSGTALQLDLGEGSKWRANPNNLPSPLLLLAVNAGAGLVPVGPTEAKKGRRVATVYEDPSVNAPPKAAMPRLFQTHSHELWVTGTGFARGTTEFTFANGLKANEDYVLTVFNRTHALVTLLDGKKWGDAGALSISKIDAGAGLVGARYALTAGKDDLQMDVQVAEVVSDADDHPSGTTVDRTAGQARYQSGIAHTLTISGQKFCEGAAADISLAFDPPLTKDADYQVLKVTATQIQLKRLANKKWRQDPGPLLLTKLKCPDGPEIAFGNGQGIAVATILPDPSVDANPTRQIFLTHTKRLTIRGAGFALYADAELSIEPTKRDDYTVTSVLNSALVIELKEGKSWVPAALQKGDTLPSIRVTQINTGAGAVRLTTKDHPDGVVVASVVKDQEGAVCDNSCEFANDGVCDDGTAASGKQRQRVKEEGDWEDDIYGNYFYGEDGGDNDDDFHEYDDDYYGAGYDYYNYGYGDDDDEEGYGYGAPVCDPGTDCDDCSAAAVNALNNPSDRCDNTCSWSKDGVCDDARVKGPCALGTDCQDCGPVGASNFTQQDGDDEWWDDEGNYWDDDYEWDDGNEFAGTKYDDDEGRRQPVAHIQSTAHPKEPKEPRTIGDPGAGGIFVIVLQSVVYLIGLVFCCGGLTYVVVQKNSGKSVWSAVPTLDPATLDPKSSVQMKKLAVTPDTTYSGSA